MEMDEAPVGPSAEGAQRQEERTDAASPPPPTAIDVSPAAPEVVTDPATGLKVVIIGCCHGELDAMYDSINHLQEKQNIKIDLVLCCGDFQAVRNMTDLNSLACPATYRRINTFYKYYSGEMVAPVMTIFVGGNHEASNHLTELYYGGWVAPNIYFLGMSGVVNFGGLRIGGLSGIYKKFDYKKGHYEMPPYSNDTMRSVYHVREFEVFKLMQLTQRLNVMLSHDWPRGIALHGNTERLLRAKSFLRREIETGVFGSPPAEDLLHTLQPEYWFSAHMHVKFPAVVHHENGQMTKFLALDKVMPNRDFLQVWDFPEAKGPKELTYDEEWLAIVKSTNHMLSFSRGTVHMPHPNSGQRFDYRPTQEEREWIRERVAAKNDGWRVPHNFVQTAPTYTPGDRKGGQAGVLCESPQRTAYLGLLDLPDLFLAYDPATASAPPHASQHHHHHGGSGVGPPRYHAMAATPSFYSPQPPLPLPLPLPTLVPGGLTVASVVAPQLASLFPVGSVQAKNEEEIDLSFDGDDDQANDGDGEERRGEDETEDGSTISAKRQRVGEQQQQTKNGEEIELDLDDEGEEDA